MAKVIVIGDGPAGLSAALFLAKNGHDAVIYAQDNTAMHYAQLHNYLGVADIPGSEFQRIARDQARVHGAQLRDEEVTEVTRVGEGFTVRAADGGEDSSDYLVLTAGKSGLRLAEQLGAQQGEQGVAVDGDGRTSVDRVYAAGRLTRARRSQAIISAGVGAAAALDILALEAGKDVTDWDTPPDS